MRGGGPVLDGWSRLLLPKGFGGTGILPVRVHRLKTCATHIFQRAANIFS